MKTLIELNQIERQLILYDVFISLEEVTYGDIRFALPKVEKRTLQRDIKDLKDAGLICVSYSKERKAYIHLEMEQEENESKNINEKDGISKKKKQHLVRLQRVTKCELCTPGLVSAYDGYGVFIKDGKMMRRL